jgi:hypothetical protein
MKNIDKIDRFSEKLNTMMTTKFNSFVNTGYFLSKKFFFVFGLDVMLKEKKIPLNGCEYITIQNNSELDYLIKALDIYKSNTFKTRVENNMNDFPIYLELKIGNSIEVLS